MKAGQSTASPRLIPSAARHKHDRVRAVGGADGITHAAERRELLPRIRGDLRPENILAALDDRPDRIVDCGPETAALRLEVDELDRWRPGLRAHTISSSRSGAVSR